jgi:hypothetical protein
LLTNNQSIARDCVVLVFIGILLIPPVSAGTNIVTTSTGKSIITPWVIPSTTFLPLWSDRELCGSCLTASDDTFLSKASSEYHTIPKLTNPHQFVEEDALASQLLSRLWAPPANYAEITKTTPFGNPFIKPYANASIYYPETATASGITNRFGGKGFLSSY